MTTDKCFSCERKDVSALCTICGVGQNGEREYYKQKPITNADRIRAMTDEELAEEFIHIQNDIADYFLSKAEKEPHLPTQLHEWLSWLKRECE